MKVNQVHVTSSTTMLDSIALRKALRDFEYGTEASFLPGVGAFPTTRPGYSPALDNSLTIHPDFQRNVDLVVDLFYPDRVDVSESSYSIRKEAKIGLPYNDRSRQAHIDFFDELIHKPLNLDFAGHYIYGSRIQTDSDKIRFTGYVQLKAVGEGFQAQRHRMINAGPACNHLLGIYQFDYHHSWLTRFPKTFNVVVDNFVDSGFGYAIDYKHFERSLGWDIVWKSMARRLHELGRHKHADLLETMTFQNYVHFRPTFGDREMFDAYLKCATDVSHYLRYVEGLYGTHFHKDELIEKTMAEMVKERPNMEKTFADELECPKSILSGYRVWHISQVQNPSGANPTADGGKIYSISDTMCRLTEVLGIRWNTDLLIDLLEHKLSVRVSNLGDDNMLFTDEKFDFDKFLAVQTGVAITAEEPVGFLSRICSNEVAPHLFRNAELIPKSASFFRKLSRERDVFKYKLPSLGFSDSLHYAQRNPTFRQKEAEIAALYRQLYMSFSDIIQDLQTRVDTKVDPGDIEYIAYLDDPGKLFRDNIVDPSEILPEYYYSIGPETRQIIINLNA